MKEQIKQHLTEIAKLRGFTHVKDEFWEGRYKTPYIMTMNGFIISTEDNRHSYKCIIIQ